MVHALGQLLLTPLNQPRQEEWILAHPSLPSTYLLSAQHLLREEAH